MRSAKPLVIHKVSIEAHYHPEWLRLVSAVDDCGAGYLWHYMGQSSYGIDGHADARRQCSSGIQAVADVASAIKAGFYNIGIAAGVESMTTDPMGWGAPVNPGIKDNQEAADCMLPMGESLPPHLLS